MKNILWIIARPKETIKINFKTNWITYWLVKILLKNKNIEFIKNDKLKGYTCKCVIADEFNDTAI